MRAPNYIEERLIDAITRVRKIRNTTLRIATFKILHAGLRRIDLRFSTVTIDGLKMEGRTSEVIERYILLFGQWEPQLTALSRRFLEKGDTAIDVGANVGYYTLLFSRLVGESGTVLAFEGLPSTQSKLMRNVDINGASNVEVRKVAVGDHDGQIEVFHSKSGDSGSSATIAVGQSEGDVPLSTLDRLLLQIDVEKIKLIKIDVEGDELRVLRGASATVSRLTSGAAVILELSPNMVSARGEEWSSINDLLPAIKFDAFVIENKYSISHYARNSPQTLRPWQRVIFGRSALELLFIRR